MSTNKLDVYEFGRQLLRANDPLLRWRLVVGFPKYLISNHGQVKTRHKRSRSVDGYLKLVTDSDGYLIAGLWNDSTKKQERHFVHKLVLEAFVGPRPEGMQACHGQGGNQDNRVTNLRWGTPKSNHADAVKSGTHTGFQKAGEGNHFAKMTDAKVAELKRLRAEGWKLADLAERFGISTNHAGALARGEVWKTRK